MPLPWLKNVKRRTLKDIKHWLTPKEVYKLIVSKSWDYKINIMFYRTRDRSLMALYYLTAGRNLELLPNPKRDYEGIHKSDFDMDSNLRFIILRGMQIVKRKKETIAKMGAKVTQREPIRLPNYPKARLYPFTKLVLEYLELLKDDDVLFEFGRQRSWQIINHVTGKWVHWFRAMSEAQYGKIFRDPVELAKFVGVTNVQSVMPYIPFDEERYEKVLLERG